ncbi:N-formylglutamate amidohydrolase [Sphingomonas histidinilytica]|jgi:N-formylglutamate amidohydrolase|uniref:N-formylglutamate amidohydrolase n=1 Tax=Rhizorhabdus histidinilytica TaxID=439228 RepID=A0A1T5A0I5_9SPHN|nr:N-formylglutamate amidohydrolase [Rhizorhabdus histidinilytica]MBO9376051.1 N-formylglutamate amidohydrolase [Rhizorhabdus histidinilytica]QEH78437.1 N-formylglutamate amidohydrolase [Sphingomonas sp. C8-2]SKB28480.1 N-formylglutamate amidohydrolase [Rhizorhabdus histidinilytica]
MASEPAFSILGPATPRSPVLLAVPHAGRSYPAEVVARARVPMERLRALEDRHAERLVAQAVDAGATAIVAHLARAAIDLNRDPREIDPAMIEGKPGTEGLLMTGKVRAGLGLFPRRLPSCGELWRTRMPVDAAMRRIAEVHEPYHRAIAERIEATRAVFGAAVLIDCHSMPPLPVRQAGGPVRIVIGDRFGAGAAGAVVDLVLAVIDGVGLRAARNHPYAGGYTIDRHGRPRRQVHAIQIEYDRSLYLDAALDAPTAQIEDCGRLLAAIVAELGALFSPDLPMAAE